MKLKTEERLLNGSVWLVIAAVCALLFLVGCVPGLPIPNGGGGGMVFHVNPTIVINAAGDAEVRQMETAEERNKEVVAEAESTVKKKEATLKGMVWGGATVDEYNEVICTQNPLAPDCLEDEDEMEDVK